MGTTLVAGTATMNGELIALQSTAVVNRRNRRYRVTIQMAADESANVGDSDSVPILVASGQSLELFGNVEQIFASGASGTIVPWVAHDLST